MVGGQDNLPPPPANEDDMVRLNISFSAQNCNSLNVSGLTKNTRSKVTSILNLNTDIIFLSDIRLGNKSKHISDLFRLKYRFHHNSSLNRRGVAILVRNELDFDITDTVQDQDENVIFIAGTHSGTKLILGSVYGPNDNNKNFFEFIEATLARFSEHRVCLGGDWNTTVSSAPVDANPDVFNMHSIPSLERSNWLTALMDNCRLIDPFRYANPTLTDFSYFPYGNVEKTARESISFSSRIPW